VKIRKAGLKDAYTLSVLTHRFFPYTGLGYAHVVARLKNPQVEYFVAEEKGATAGFTDVEHQDNGKAKILGLAVLPEFQRRGIGQALLSTALEAAAGRGAAECVILVAEDNETARKLYDKNGFSRSGVLDRKLWNKTVLLMSKAL